MQKNSVCFFWILDYGALHLRLIREIKFLQRFRHSVALLQVQRTDLFVAIYYKNNQRCSAPEYLVQIMRD